MHRAWMAFQRGGVIDGLGKFDQEGVLQPREEAGIALEVIHLTDGVADALRATAEAKSCLGGGLPMGNAEAGGATE